MKRRSKPIRVLVTGGPTRAYLDRVRYLSNVSTGALAFEVCRELIQQNVEVLLVSGPTEIEFQKLQLSKWAPVITNDEMYESVMTFCRKYRPDFAVFSAAVLDFAPEKIIAGKVSSKSTGWNLKLKPTKKIIDEVGRRFPKIARIGFKLEWDKPNLEASLQFGFENLKSKGLDSLCLNYLPEISGKKHPALLLTDAGEVTPANSKREIARWISRRVKLAAAASRPKQNR